MVSFTIHIGGDTYHFLQVNNVTTADDVLLLAVTTIQGHIDITIFAVRNFTTDVVATNLFNRCHILLVPECRQYCVITPLHQVNCGHYLYIYHIYFICFSYTIQHQYTGTIAGILS